MERRGWSWFGRRRERRDEGDGSPARLARARWGTEELADQDSNLDKQNQNLLCYRYTIGQRERLEPAGTSN